MSSRALVLVHDPAKSRRDRIPGALIPAFARRDIDHHIFSFVCARPAPAPDISAYDLLVVMGSHESADDPRVPWLAHELAFVTKAVERGIPTIGICFGGQLLARALHGEVTRADFPERGFTVVKSDDPDLIPQGFWMQLHADSFIVPPGATELARNASGSQAFVAANALGLQFHPEITVDSFDSWVERWVESGGLPEVGDSGLDPDALRREIAQHEQDSVRACDQLVDTFCTRYMR
ncbi:type 1 glutamine amidotransferase [Streptomyces lydicus]|uniref:type 1 glutamine amidotransferase n=1 Tax=Streptomyces lydicus TaxID=47763 RepID=UPI0036EEBB20